MDNWVNKVSRLLTERRSELTSPTMAQIGYPLLTITENSSGVKIRQNRYLSSADATVGRPTVIRIGAR